MKRNKIAAGALALALGFGAVAPVHAAEDKPSSESIKELIKDMRAEKENLDTSSEKIMDALGKAQEIEREKAAQEGEAGVEDNNNTGDTTEPGEGGKTESGKGGTTEPGKGGTTEPGKGGTTEPGKGGTTEPGKGGTTEPGKGGTTEPGKGGTTEPGKGGTTEPGKGGTTEPGKGGTTTSDDDKNKGKKVYDLADNEAKGYDTKADAIAAAKQALADKAYNTAGNNSYEVAKNENNGKWFFKLVIDTDKAIAEENKEDKKEDKKEKDNKSQAPARKADSNAQTGVAGLVSVASILGAASVAYVASKKRD